MKDSDFKLVRITNIADSFRGNYKVGSTYWLVHQSTWGFTLVDSIGDLEEFYASDSLLIEFEDARDEFGHIKWVRE